VAITNRKVSAIRITTTSKGIVIGVAGQMYQEHARFVQEQALSAMILKIHYIVEMAFIVTHSYPTPVYGRVRTQELAHHRHVLTKA
jgi:hypothetical protein